jgi:hypothetical protein
MPASMTWETYCGCLTFRIPDFVGVHDTANLAEALQRPMKGKDGDGR